jgi:Protein of unknown function (DUF2786)
MIANDREKLVARVKALLQMTIAKGCTQQEATSARAKAREIMRTYGIAEPEVGLPTEANRRAARSIIRKRSASDLLISVSREALPDGEYIYTVSMSGPGYGRINLPATDRGEARALADGLVTLVGSNTWVGVRKR